MESQDDRPLYVRRIDPARNMARFYLLCLQPTLFGDVSLLRNWGRIGTRGRTKIETFETADGAATALRRIERAKRRRGYGDERRPEPDSGRADAALTPAGRKDGARP